MSQAAQATLVQAGAVTENIDKKFRSFELIYGCSRMMEGKIWLLLPW